MLLTHTFSGYIYGKIRLDIDKSFFRTFTFGLFSSERAEMVVGIYFDVEISND